MSNYHIVLTQFKCNRERQLVAAGSCLWGQVPESGPRLSVPRGMARGMPAFTHRVVARFAVLLTRPINDTRELDLVLAGAHGHHLGQNVGYLGIRYSCLFALRQVVFCAGLTVDGDRRCQSDKNHGPLIEDLPFRRARIER